MKYILIDLERSILTGIVHYWNPNKRGYTTNLKYAGQYHEAIASEIIESDFDKRTIMISIDTVEHLFV